MSNYDDIIKKYSSKLEKEFSNDNSILDEQSDENRVDIVTDDYKSFINDYSSNKNNWYVKGCRFSGKLFDLKIPKEKEDEINEYLSFARIDVSASSTMSFAFLASLSLAMISLILVVSTGSLLMYTLPFMIGGFTYFILSTYPKHLAQQWRIKTSSQMVMAIFYLTTYMRHSSNLELALKFTADHIDPPISLDFMGIVWQYETGAKQSVKAALDEYLEQWRKSNLEFVESIHLIESSLLEGDERRRLDLLDRSLEQILNETYEKMLHYAQELHSPVTMVTMLGVILPMLTMIILPLAVSFMEGVRWYHLFAFYDVILPIIIFYLVYDILSTRPTGNIAVGSNNSFEDPKYSDMTKLIIKDKKNPKNVMKIDAINISLFILIIFLLFGFSPIIIHFLNPNFEMEIMGFKMMDYTQDKLGSTLGPFGMISTFISYLIPLGIAMAISAYFYIKNINLKKIKDRGKGVDKDIVGALYQLGNRLGDGIPTELAIDTVSKNLDGTASGEFFKDVSYNINQVGLGLKDAIFDEKYGAINKYPSAILQTAMKILIQTSSKSPLASSFAMINISNYLKRIHEVDERLKDIMSDILSTIKSQISFVAPVITSVVVAITSMISMIILSLTKTMENFSGEGGMTANLTSMFDVGVPTFYFQMVVGFYVVQIIVILSVLYSAIKDGSDKVEGRIYLAKSTLKATVIYSILGLILSTVFATIATSVMGTI